MRKLFKGALIAGAAGGVLGGVQALRKDEPTEAVAQQALKGAGEAAALGAVVGWMLDRRDKKRTARRRASVGAALTTGGLIEAARAARPALEHALEAVAQAAEQARPHVEHAAEVTRERAALAAEAARPKLEQAARVAAERGREAAEAARPAMERAAEATLPRIEHAARAAADRSRDLAARVA